MKLRQFDKFLKEDKHRFKSLLNLALKPFKALNFGFLGKPKAFIGRLLNAINKAPVGVVALFVVIGVGIFVLVANKLRYEFFVNLITTSFPEAVTVPADSAGRPLYMSALDRMFAEFEAEINVGWFLLFIIGLRNFLRKIWLNYNPRKRQVF